ncbi:hypothetical protein D3C87_1584990 [compost metagenome]
MARNFLYTDDAFCRSYVGQRLSANNITNCIITFYRSVVKFVNYNLTFFGFDTCFFQTDVFDIGYHSGCR